MDDRTERMLKKMLGAISASAGNNSESTENFLLNPQGPLTPGHTSKSAENEDVAKASTGLSSPTSDHKKRIFVALPFSEEFQNVYEFGIYPATRKCGFICERVDETHFAGDVLSRIRERIETADLVIADLTGGRPNVYLEVGYAWGKGIPVIFVAKKEEKLHFDVSTHRCIFYGKFTQFAKDLEELILGIEAAQQS